MTDRWMPRTFGTVELSRAQLEAAIEREAWDNSALLGEEEGGHDGTSLLAEGAEAAGRRSRHGGTEWGGV